MKMMRAMGLALCCAAASACVSAQSALGAPQSEDLDIYPNPAYRYQLSESLDPAVCQHMLRVYETEFRHPWSFREGYRKLYSSVYSWVYQQMESPNAAGAENLQRLWEMRYAMFPTSKEFEAVEWSRRDLKRSIGETVIQTPLRWAHLDINNDGVSDTLIQLAFYGESGALDVLVVIPSKKLNLNDYRDDDALV